MRCYTGIMMETGNSSKNQSASNTYSFFVLNEKCEYEKAHLDAFATFCDVNAYANTLADERSCTWTTSWCIAPGPWSYAQPQ